MSLPYSHKLYKLATSDMHLNAVKGQYCTPIHFPLMTWISTKMTKMQAWGQKISILCMFRGLLVMANLRILITMLLLNFDYYVMTEF